MAGASIIIRPAHEKLISPTVWYPFEKALSSYIPQMGATLTPHLFLSGISLTLESHQYQLENHRQSGMGATKKAHL